MAKTELTQFLEKLNQPTSVIRFVDSMALIDDLYDFSPCEFSNGEQHNAANENNGSCKIFAFAQMHQLSQSHTLALFGQYYQDVLTTPDEDDHQNIRQFMEHGWSGISFTAMPLSPKA